MDALAKGVLSSVMGGQAALPKIAGPPETAAASGSEVTVRVSGPDDLDNPSSDVGCQEDQNTIMRAVLVVAFAVASGCRQFGCGKPRC
ncbi:hypothetical protein PoB_004618800 [Plakobranchus ocellatus]|uniref:Uncharacterized protein n=1 Tax=Plakobranchus ocellatus TaxID=259542 RepID=A0AAV4BKK3_9GAST|nr:hypothetical protein PoB_004618800 [Plakobranchus ocellatus]